MKVIMEDTIKSYRKNLKASTVKWIVLMSGLLYLFLMLMIVMLNSQYPLS